MSADQFRYSIRMIEELLPCALNPNWTGELPVPLSSYNDGTKVKSGKPISEGGDHLVMVMDVRRAFRAGYYDPISVCKFLNGEPAEEAVDADAA